MLKISKATLIFSLLIVKLKDLQHVETFQN